MRVVPPFEVLEGDQPRFGLRLEATAIEQLALERGEESSRRAFTALTLWGWARAIASVFAWSSRWGAK